MITPHQNDVNQAIIKHHPMDMQDGRNEKERYRDVFLSLTMICNLSSVLELWITTLPEASTEHNSGGEEAEGEGRGQGENEVESALLGVHHRAAGVRHGDLGKENEIDEIGLS